MKTLLSSLLLIIIALFLIASNSSAQSKDSDRDWIDSLAVRYRIDFIESAMLRDQAVLDSISAKVYALVFNMRNERKCEKTPGNDLAKTIRQYNDERHAQKIRRRAYNKELISVRTNFSSL